MLMANKKPACASTEHHQDTNFCTIPPLPQLCTLCPKQNTTEMDFHPIKSERFFQMPFDSNFFCKLLYLSLILFYLFSRECPRNVQ